MMVLLSVGYSVGSVFSWICCNLDIMYINSKLTRCGASTLHTPRCHYDFSGTPHCIAANQALQSPCIPHSQSHFPPPPCNIACNHTACLSIARKHICSQGLDLCHIQQFHSSMIPSSKLETSVTTILVHLRSHLTTTFQTSDADENYHLLQAEE